MFEIDLFSESKPKDFRAFHSSFDLLVRSLKGAILSTTLKIFYARSKDTILTLEKIV